MPFWIHGVLPTARFIIQLIIIFLLLIKNDKLVQQKLAAKRDGARIDRHRDVERLWEFYQLYKRRHRVDDIQREEQKWRESGSFTANFGEYG